jgi:hypothetical protein
MWEVETAVSLQSVAPRETGLEQLSSSLEFSMREMAPSLFRLGRTRYIAYTVLSQI